MTSLENPFRPELKVASIIDIICQDESCAGREQERKELEEEETWLSMLLKCEDFKGHLVKVELRGCFSAQLFLAGQA